MRRLALHASALSDAEYEFFTKSLLEIADDEVDGAAKWNDSRFEEITIGVREARAWFRGRYSHVPLSHIDGILKFFAPNVGREDVINGTEFFAALRLVTHAENGRDIDRSLAFIQADQSIARASRSPSRVADNHPSAASIVSTDSGSYTNPFPISYPHPDPLPHSAFNPFLSARSNDPNLPPLPPRRPLPSSSTFNNPHAPPPPPRQPATPRVERSISPSKSYSNPGSIPPIPPKPSQHVTSTLIKQSLQARKVAQSMKKAEEQLDKERVLQVLKSSSIVTGAYPLAGASVVGSSVVIGTNIHNQHQHQHPNIPSSGAKGPKSLTASISSESEGVRPPVPPLPKRRRGFPPSQQPSPPLSDSSLEQVALASSLPHPEYPLASHVQDNANPHSTSNPFNKEESSNNPLPAPPPMHPARNPTFGYHQLNPSPKPPTDLQNTEAFEAVYGVMSSRSISPFRSGSISTTPQGPPTFPPPLDTITTAGSQTRPFRSQSLSHHSPVSQAPLPPPVRRKRPESIQLLRNADDTSGSLSRHSSLHGSRGVGHRKSSLSLSSTSSFRSRTSSPFTTDDNTLHRLNSGASTSSVGGNNSASGVVGTNIQRTIEALHHIHGQLQPKFEKARYKAEAGLSKRGYVRSTVRSSGEESPAAVDSEEQEGLTRETTTGRWPEPHIGQPQTKVGDGDVSESDESEWNRGRATNLSGPRSPKYTLHPSPTKQNGQ